MRRIFLLFIYLIFVTFASSYNICCAGVLLPYDDVSEINNKSVIVSVKSNSTSIQISNVNDFYPTNAYYIVDKNINLEGEILIIPKGCCIDFKGGSLYNGKVVFQETLLLGDVKCYTDICGTLRNNNIAINWFEDLQGERPDISDVLQKTIEFVADMATESMTYKPNLVYIEAGEYTMTKTVNVRAFAKLRTSGFVKIVSKISNAPMFVLCPSAKDLKATFNGNNESGFNLPYKTNAYLNGKWIDGSNGLLLECESLDMNAVAIAVGADSSVTKVTGPLISSKFSVEFVTIQGFKKGIVLHGYHNYINGYVNLNMQYNEICISQEQGSFYGTTFKGSTNYDENIKFTSCIFGGVRTNGSVVSKIVSCDINTALHFQNCSIDYATLFFFDNSYNEGQQEIYDWIYELQSRGVNATMYQLKAKFGDTVEPTIHTLVSLGKLQLVDKTYYIVLSEDPTIRIHIDNCHIEGIGDGGENTEEEGKYGFFSKGFSMTSSVHIMNSRLVLISTRNHYMLFSNKRVNVFMTNNVINATQTYNGRYNIGYAFLSNKYVNSAQFYRCDMYVDQLHTVKVAQGAALSPYNNIVKDGFFSNVGEVNVSAQELSSGYSLNGLFIKNNNPEIECTLSANEGVESPFAEYGGRAIQVNIPAPSGVIPDEGMRKPVTLHVETPYFKVEDLGEYLFNYGVYHHSDLGSAAQSGGSRFRVKGKVVLYNDSDEIVGEIKSFSDNITEGSVFPGLPELDAECWAPCLNKFNVPSIGATKAKVVLDMNTLIWNGGYLKFTGFYVEKN